MKKSTSKQIFTYVVLFGILILVAVYFLVYQKNVEKTEALQASNANLQNRVNDLKVYYDNEATYLAEMEPMKTEIAEILSKYPSENREEDVIMQAVITQMTTPMEYTTVNIGDTEVMKAISADVVKGAGIEAYQTDINFNAQKATYANKLNYSNLKAAIKSLYDSKYVIGISGITYSDTEEISTDEIVDIDAAEGTAVENTTTAATEETGKETELTGTLNLVFYSVSGTGKEYVLPEILPYESGTGNIFGQAEEVEEE